MVIGMIKVLFVCLGNICRSPMAEALFRDLVKKEGLEGKILVDSAGTGNWHVGEPPHRGTQKILKEKNISIEGIKARQINRQDLEEFDYIITMDSDNKRNVERMKRKDSKTVIRNLLEYVPEISNKDVPDPYYTGNFSEVYDLVKQGCTMLLHEIKKSHPLN